MCKFCGDPDCNADDMVDEMFGSDGEEIIKKYNEFKKKIESETEILQDVAISDIRTFKSSVWRPTEEGTFPEYKSIDSMLNVIGESLDALENARIKKELEGGETAGVSALLDSFRDILDSKGDITMDFVVSVNKNHVTLSVKSGIETVSNMMFSNVHTVEDVLKLISYTNKDFVDNVLIDYAVIKEVLESK